MSFARTLVLLSATLVSTAALAQQMRPGLWEFSMSGVPMKQTICITPDMAKDPTSLGKDPQMPDTDCKSSKPTVSGKTTSFTVSCTRPQKMHTKMTLTNNSPDSFTMKQDYDMEMGGQRHRGSTTMNYKRLGDCK
ncbi:MAG TPA: DUF3617 family protein [Burkholderiales bacterium]|nr:DUF3617 family protein [Burkholderiales bacterium]